MKSDPATVSIGELAERTGLALSAIRFYESKGLVTPTRTAGGQRRFARADIRRLSFVMITQTLGFTLATIREHLDALPEDGRPTRRDWERLARGFRDDPYDVAYSVATLELRGTQCFRSLLR